VLIAASRRGQKRRVGRLGNPSCRGAKTRGTSRKLRDFPTPSHTRCLIGGKNPCSVSQFADHVVTRKRLRWVPAISGTKPHLVSIIERSVPGAS